MPKMVRLHQSSEISRCTWGRMNEKMEEMLERVKDLVIQINKKRKDRP
jgi:hypothetical protein